VEQGHQIDWGYQIEGGHERARRTTTEAHCERKLFEAEVTVLLYSFRWSLASLYGVIVGIGRHAKTGMGLPFQEFSISGAIWF
jgi:hypothetical protein